MADVRSRDDSLDVARGLIMALMALDHTRMFFASAQFDPVAIEQTTLGYFITRWVTHLCAPGFFFLAGMGAALAERGGLSPARSTFWLISRGLWLVAIEFTIIGFAWSFNIGWSWLGVIWSLGVSMAALGLLRWAPKVVLAVGAAAIIAGHNFLPVQALIGDASARAWLYGAGLVSTPLGPKIALFPIVPWLAVMVLGYALADWFAPQRRSSPSRFAIAGIAGLALFALLRALDVGQPSEGGAVAYDDPIRSGMSFFNVEKYPPSLQFVLVTLGAVFLFIALAAWLRERAGSLDVFRPLLEFGRVPFAFYVLHLYLIHALALVSAAAFGWPAEFLFWNGVGPNLQPPDGYGFGLSGVYGAWLAVLLILYPVCAWFAAIKERRRSWWLRYL